VCHLVVEEVSQVRTLCRVLPVWMAGRFPVRYTLHVYGVPDWERGVLTWLGPAGGGRA
jgi:hypothetical protein